MIPRVPSEARDGVGAALVVALVLVLVETSGSWGPALASILGVSR